MFLRTGLDVPSLKSGIFVKRHCWQGQFPLSHVEFSTTTSTGLKRAGALLKLDPGESVRVEFEGALTKAELDRAQGASSPSIPGTETTPLTPAPLFMGMDPIHALPGSSGLHLHQLQPRRTLKQSLANLSGKREKESLIAFKANGPLISNSQPHSSSLLVSGVQCDPRVGGKKSLNGA